MTPAAKAAALLMLACGAGSATAAICPGGPYSFPIPDGAQAVHLDNALLLDEFNHFGALDANVEGALWRGGSVFVSEFGAGTQPPPSRILQITGNQPGVVFAADAGTNGLATDAAGVLYGASHKIGGIVHFATQIRDGDGMVVDCAGNLYVTSTDVVVLDPAGLEIGRIVMPVGAGQITNVAFGGPKRKTLYITAMGSGQARGVFKVKLAVPGLPY